MGKCKQFVDGALVFQEARAAGHFGSLYAAKGDLDLERLGAAEAS